MKTIKHTLTKADYKATLKRIEELIASNPKKGTNNYIELDQLGALVSAFEEINYPIK